MGPSVMFMRRSCAHTCGRRTRQPPPGHGERARRRFIIYLPPVNALEDGIAEHAQLVADAYGDVMSGQRAGVARATAQQNAPIAIG
jgi:hypothetical protein